MFIVLSGKLGVWVDQSPTHSYEIQSGFVFGEKALEINEIRIATVKSLTYCKLLRLWTSDY